MHVGIDYGSKLAGTTSLCYLEEKRVHFLSSKKKQDADQMISVFLRENPRIQQVFIDAPLSLPRAYTHNEENRRDFFYRKSDREIRAMSPMFLGGLTARAMQLAYSFKERAISFIESYPSGLVDELRLDRSLYKKEVEHIQPIAHEIAATFALTLASIPRSWHEVDALLAYAIGIRYQDGSGKFVGDPAEGLIHF